MKSKYTKGQIVFIQHSILFTTIISIGAFLSMWGLITTNYKLMSCFVFSFMIGALTILIGVIRVIILDFEEDNKNL